MALVLQRDTGQGHFKVNWAASTIDRWKLTFDLLPLLLLFLHFLVSWLKPPAGGFWGNFREKQPPAFFFISGVVAVVVAVVVEIYCFGINEWVRNLFQLEFNWNSIRIEEIFCWKVVVVQLLLLFDIFGKDCLPFKAAILFFIQKEKNEETFHALLLLMLLMLLMLLVLLLLVFASRALIEWGFILLFSALFTRGFLILIFAFIDMHWNNKQCR